MVAKVSKNIVRSLYGLGLGASPHNRGWRLGVYKLPIKAAKLACT